MKIIKKKILSDSFVFSKICISNPTPQIDFSHLNTLLGSRFVFFSLLNPFLIRTSLKSGLLALEAFLANKYKLIFIVNIENQILLNKFYQVCKKKKIIFIKSSDISLGSLTSSRVTKSVLVTLFLPSPKMETIQKEAALIGMPILSFGNLLTNKNSSTLFIAGNYSIFTIQNLILTLITICLEKKNESA